jgi:hypothetical protein
LHQARDVGCVVAALIACIPFHEVPEGAAKSFAGHHFMQLLNTPSFREIAANQTIYQVSGYGREEFRGVLNDIADFGVG